MTEVKETTIYELFLTPEERKDYESKNLQGSNIRFLEGGFSTDVMQSKLIVYVARELYKTVQQHKGVENLIKWCERQGLTMSYKRKPDGERVTYPLIRIYLSDIAEWLQGEGAPNKKQVKGYIINSLDQLSKTYLVNVDNPELTDYLFDMQFMPGKKDEEKKILFLTIREPLIEGIKGSYFVMTERAFAFMGKIKNFLQFNLYIYLLNLLSNNTIKDYSRIRIGKETVDRQVVPRWYIEQRKPSKLKHDFDEAEKMMKKEGILKALHRKEIKGNLFYIFNINKDYIIPEKYPLLLEGRKELPGKKNEEEEPPKKME